VWGVGEQECENWVRVYFDELLGSYACDLDDSNEEGCIDNPDDYHVVISGGTVYRREGRTNTGKARRAHSHRVCGLSLELWALPNPGLELYPQPISLGTQDIGTTENIAQENQQMILVNNSCYVVGFYGESLRVIEKLGFVSTCGFPPVRLF